MNRLEVKASRVHVVLEIALGLWFAGAGLASVTVGLVWWNPTGLLIGAAMLSMYGFLAWVFRRSRTRSVRYLSAHGLERNDGRSLAWADLSRVVTQIHDGSIWRVEIHFTNGECAWLIPGKVANFAEVRAVVRDLPCEHAEVEV